MSENKISLYLDLVFNSVFLLCRFLAVLAVLIYAPKVWTIFALILLVDGSIGAWRLYKFVRYAAIPFLKGKAAAQDKEEEQGQEEENEEK